MKILGIDPGLVKTGYGLIEASDPRNIKFLKAGVIKTSDRDKISDREKRIENEVSRTRNISK